MTIPTIGKQWSNEKNPGWLGYIGDYTTQLYRDYFINHYKDPYKPSSIMESRKVFFVAQWELIDPIAHIVKQIGSRGSSLDLRFELRNSWNTTTESNGSQVLKIGDTFNEQILLGFWAICVFFINIIQPQMLNVWYIYLHLPPKLPKCR